MIRTVLTMTASDLRQRVRDRSVIIFALVVPLALMYVFNLVFGGVQDPELQPVTVAVSTPDDDPLAGAFVQVLGQVDAMDVTVQEVDGAQVAELAESGEADLGVVVPDGFAAGLFSGQGLDVQVTEGDEAGLETDIVLSVLQGVLDQFTAGTVAGTAGAQLELGPAELAQIAQQAATAGPFIELVPGEASSEQLGAAAALVAGQAGFFLLFTVGFGVLGLVAEREQGTLARLRSMPMRPSAVVTAKALVSCVLGVVATTVLLTVGGWFFDVGFGSPGAVAVLIVCVVLASTSIMFIIARISQTAEQAGVAQSIVAIVLGIAGGAFFPIAATGTVGSLLDLNPVAAFTRGLGISAGGGGIGDLGAPVALLLGFAVVVLLISRVVPDRGARL